MCVLRVRHVRREVCGRAAAGAIAFVREDRVARVYLATQPKEDVDERELDVDAVALPRVIVVFARRAMCASVIARLLVPRGRRVGVVAFLTHRSQTLREDPLPTSVACALRDRFFVRDTRSVCESALRHCDRDGAIAA